MMLLLILAVVAILIYIFRNADFNESCIPDEECGTCPFPCDKRKN